MDNARTGSIESAVMEALRERLKACRLSRREIERMLDLGHGTISKILRGQTGLKFQHLDLLGPLLGTTPEQILEEALGLVAESPVEDRFARRVASHVVDELLQRASIIDPLVLSTPNS